MSFFLHNENQFFVPNRAKIFGSTAHIMQMAKCNKSTGCHRRFKISRVFWSARDYPKQRCDEVEKRPNTTQCIMSSIRDKVGCYIPIQDMKPDGKLLCNTKEQFDEIMTLVSVLSRTDDESEIYKLTGCLSSCKKVSSFFSSLGNNQPIP